MKTFPKSAQHQLLCLKLKSSCGSWKLKIVESYSWVPFIRGQVGCNLLFAFFPIALESTCWRNHSFGSQLASVTVSSFTDKFSSPHAITSRYCIRVCFGQFFLVFWPLVSAVEHSWSHSIGAEIPANFLLFCRQHFLSSPCHQQIIAKDFPTSCIHVCFAWFFFQARIFFSFILISMLILWP